METLSDTGLIFNSTKCSITTNKLRTLSEIHGGMHSTIDATHFYIPDKIMVVADHEVPLIKQITPEEVA
jgi:hypothetical protein